MWTNAKGHERQWTALLAGKKLNLLTCSFVTGYKEMMLLQEDITVSLLRRSQMDHGRKTHPQSTGVPSWSPKRCRLVSAALMAGALALMEESTTR